MTLTELEWHISKVSNGANVHDLNNLKCIVRQTLEYSQRFNKKPDQELLDQVFLKLRKYGIILTEITL